MLNKALPISLDKDMLCLAAAVILTGVVVISLAGWETIGWLIVAFGAEMLWLAYHIAVAPYDDEPGTVRR